MTLVQPLSQRRTLSALTVPRHLRVQVLVFLFKISTTIGGLTATRKGDNIILLVIPEMIRDVGSTGIIAAGTTYFGAPADGQSGAAAKMLTQTGGIRLDSTANQPISIELGDLATVSEHGFLER